MAVIVQKYGGTSVGNTDRIKNVARRVAEYRQRGDQVVVVVSAMSGVTDGLIKLAKDIVPLPSEREMDMLLATGEQQTIDAGRASEDLLDQDERAAVDGVVVDVLNDARPVLDRRELKRQHRQREAREASEQRVVEQGPATPVLLDRNGVVRYAKVQENALDILDPTEVLKAFKESGA